MYYPTSFGPEIEPWLGLRGFTVVYRRPDVATLRKLREYQVTLPAGYPGWMSRLDYAEPNREVRLHVFPRNELVQSMWHAVGSYAYAS
jgi:hypothetical protein